eukprot:7196640-Ditylum_brightwellii.AAC.1
MIDPFALEGPSLTWFRYGSTQKTATFYMTHHKFEAAWRCAASPCGTTTWLQCSPNLTRNGAIAMVVPNCLALCMPTTPLHHGLRTSLLP